MFARANAGLGVNERADLQLGGNRLGEVPAAVDEHNALDRIRPLALHLPWEYGILGWVQDGRLGPAGGRAYKGA